MVSARVAVQTRLALAGRRAPVRKTRRTPIMARQVRLHRDAVFTRRRSDSKRAQKMRNNCRRLDARAGVCCANEQQSNRKNPLRGKAAAYSRRGMRLCSRIALTGFPRGVADTQKDPPKPDHGSAGRAASRCCLYAQSFRHEAARKMRNNCRRLDARAGVCCANEHGQSNRKNTLRGKPAAYSRRNVRLCASVQPHCFDSLSAGSG